ncbi:DUF2073 domain-containing protein [Candidatus Woesearchaeota archaeon]|nr:DUF2073 domain-containing protein [Candidatus Woesearchaeota archaeon]
MLTFRFIPYYEIENLSSARRVKKLMDIVKGNSIILLEGRLKAEEEKDLIELTMEEIGPKFKGIELAVIYPEQKNPQFFDKVKHGMIGILLGDRVGFTIIGPANLVKEIKKDPDKVQFFVEEARKKKKSSR